MKCLFIYNPNSGRGKVKKKEAFIVSTLKQKYDAVDVIKTEYSGHAIKIAEDNCFNYDTIVVAGGDGTLNEIANALAGKDGVANIGYIPTGTVNDVAHSLKIPRNIKKATFKIVNGNEIKIDAYKCNEKFGVYVLAIGSLSETSFSAPQRSKKAFGKIAYFFHGAGKIFTGKTFPVKLKIEDQIIEKNCALFLAVNSRSVAGFSIHKKAILDDGLMDIVIVETSRKRVGITSLIRIARLFLFGVPKLNAKGKITHLQAKEFELITSEKTAVGIDGEHGFNGSFKYSIIHRGIKIIV